METDDTTVYVALDSRGHYPTEFYAMKLSYFRELNDIAQEFDYLDNVPKDIRYKVDEILNNSVRIAFRRILKYE